MFIWIFLEISEIDSSILKNSTSFGLFRKELLLTSILLTFECLEWQKTSHSETTNNLEDYELYNVHKNNVLISVGVQSDVFWR